MSALHFVMFCYNESQNNRTHKAQGDVDMIVQKAQEAYLLGTKHTILYWGFAWMNELYRIMNGENNVKWMIIAEYDYMMNAE